MVTRGRNVVARGRNLVARGRNVVVIGTSAGGLDALDRLFAQIPAGAPASFLVVQHMAPQASGLALLRRLDRHKELSFKLAVDGETFKPGWVYVAPPDYHLLVKKTSLLV